jgi:formylmethanofuran dehydrogenase subunit E
MRDFETLLRGSASIHGHLCPGQVVGVRMAMLGCHLIGLDDPSSDAQIKKLIVFVEMDRCAADAVAYVTGARLGRRSLKFMDYGIMAATFLNLENGKAYRVLSTEEARDLVHLYAPGVAGKGRQQLEAYMIMPECVLFRVEEVQVALEDADLPGPSRHSAVCARCGQVIRDRREVMVDGQRHCKPCAQGAYFQNRREVTWPGMNEAPSVRTTGSFLEIENRDACPPSSAGPAVSRERSKAIDQEDTH